jgi:hypothetical protein
VVAEVREKVAASKQAAQKSDVEIFNLSKLNEQEVRKQYQIKISNRFAAFIVIIIIIIIIIIIYCN